MATDAISSATTAPPQAQQNRQATEAKAIEDAAKVRQAQQQQAHKTEQPRPVTNAQGERTGAVINTTA